jgi:hypothetical protein
MADQNGARAFLDHQERLLEAERDAERAETTAVLESATHKQLAAAGLGFLNSLLESQPAAALFGRTKCTFVGKNIVGQLGSVTPKFKSGDIVGVFSNEQPIHGLKPLVDGVILGVRQGATKSGNKKEEGVKVDVLFKLDDEEGFPLENNHLYHLALVASH